MSFLKDAYRVKAQTIIKNLEKRNMLGFYVDTKEEALDKFISLINANDLVAWGGSTTLDEIGIKKLLEVKNISVINRDNAKTPEERTLLMKKALTADVFITSTNAITMDGELMNVDGVGNRLAAYKVVPDINLALARIRSEATVPNAIRLNAQSPCRFTGNCSECMGINSLCCQILITRCSKPTNRIKIILIGEELGF